MLNRSSSSSSRFGKKCSPAPATVYSKIGRKKKPSTRNPLNDINSIANSSSSTSSVSVEAPGGCLSFFLSNNSSSSSRTHVRRPKTLLKTPKSAPNARPSKPSRSASSKENLPKPSSQNVEKAKKNPPCLYQWQSARKPSSRAAQKPKPSPVLDNDGNKLGSVSEEFAHKQQQQQQQQIQQQRQQHCTPVSKLASGSALHSTLGEAIQKNSTTKDSKTPPVEASVSPEIQCGSSVLSTPACYGAGHVVSGIADKRKCRPRGILTVGDSDLGFGKDKSFDNDDDENILGFPNNSRVVSPVPSPVEASMLWLLSPCNEEDEEHKGNSGNGLHRCQRLGASTTLRSPSSPISNHGFSSDACNNSNNTTSATTTATIARSRTSQLSPTGLPEFQGFLGPLSDHMASCSSLSSLHSTPSCKATITKEERKHQSNLAGESSPLSMDSLGNENVIQTPQSDSSSDRHVGLACINADDHLTHRFEAELDSVAEVLHRTSLSPQSQISMWDLTSLSFQLTRTSTPSNSIDLSQFHKTLDYQASWISNSSLENVSQSQVRISWREGLVSRIFEMDELDCCRCLTDEEEDANGCSNDRSASHLSPELKVDVGNGQDLTNGFGSPQFVDHEPGIDGKGKEKFPSQGQSSCAESICTDGGSLVASGDSDWTLCYKNQLFEVGN